MDENETWYNWSTDASSTPASVLSLSTVHHSLNLTGVRHAKTSLLLYDVLIPLLGSLILVFNLIVVVSVALILLRSRVQNSTTYLFLGNMAAMDCVTGFAVLFGQFYPKQHRGDTTCAIQLGMIVSSTLASVWSVGLLSVDRYLYIVHGLQYNRWMTMQRARALIVVTWLIGCFLGFLPAMGWQGFTDGGKVCWFIRLAPPALVMLTTVFGVMPIVLVVVLYSIILYHAMRKVMQLRRSDADRSLKNMPQNETGPQSLRVFRGGNASSGVSSSNQCKAVKVVLFTTGSFVATWVPYFVACSVYVVCRSTNGPTGCKLLELAIAAPLAILGFLNSLLNPLIYAWWHTGFRGLARRLWCRRSTSGTGRPASSTTTTKMSITSSSSSRAADNVEELREMTGKQRESTHM